MHPDPAAVPLRIALVGLGRRGLHHLEKLSLRGDCEIAVGADPRPDRRERVAAMICRRVSRITAALLAELQIRVLWIATPASEHRGLIELGLEAGCDVVIEPPTGLSLEAFEGLERLSVIRRRSLVVLLPRRFDDDFVSAMLARESGELGELESLERTVWQLGPRELGEKSSEALQRAVFPLLDQALHLGPGIPRTIWCHLTHDHHAWGPAPTGLQLLLGFPQGTTAWMNLCWSAPAVLDTGWRLRGQRGVYAAGIRSTATASGEMIEIPDVAVPVESRQLHSRVLEHLQGKTENPGSAECIRRVLGVWEEALAVFRMTERSARPRFAIGAESD